jgi:hypothetical protein
VSGDAIVLAFAAEVDIRQIAVRLAALPERDMRVAKLAELVTAATPGQAAWLLDGLATAGRAGGPPFDVSLLAAVDLFGEERLPPAQRQAILAAAEAHGLHACMDLLSSPLALASEGLTDEPRPLVPGTRPLTLGERKSLARSWDRNVLQRLLVDPHADVVRLLLGNPHVTEDDILRIATARHADATVLGLVLGSRRFGTAPRVRRALVRNPKLPLATALRLLGLLNRRELEEIARDPHLPPRLAASIRRRLRPLL